MWPVRGLDGANLEGWQKGETENGVPYFIHHESGQTQWDHPLLIATMEEILDSNNIKYAAYRTAMKIRTLQKFAKLHLVTLPTTISLFDQHGFRPDKNDARMTSDELEGVLADIFHVTKREQVTLVDIELLAEIMRNILMNFYDRQRSGTIKVSSVKVALTVLCSARLQEKYKYLFRQFADHNNCISKKKLTELLNDLAQIPEYISENPSFGVSFVTAAVESCFAIDSSRLGVSEEAFLSWLLKQPQTLVWVSTLYRLAAAETVNHEAKCSICKMHPITGLRYQCLRCFHYDLCQNCFFTGQLSRSHKLNHPLQEYCHKSTSKEGTKALMKMIKNKLSKKTSAKSKQRYLPINIGNNLQNGTAIHADDASADSSQDKDSVVVPEKASKMLQTENVSDEGLCDRTVLQSNGGGPDESTVGQLGQDQRRELESVIVNLEDENRHLLSEIEKLQSMSSNLAIASPPTAEQQQRAMMLARQEALEDHNHQLELQLRRLRGLLQYLQRTPLRSGPMKPIVNAQQRMLHRLESTPAAAQPGGACFNLLSPINHGTPPPLVHSCNGVIVGWDRPFGGQSGPARRSLPQPISLSTSTPSPFEGQSFQRSSARAILQSHDRQQCTPTSLQTYNNSPLYGGDYTFQDISRDLLQQRSNAGRQTDQNGHLCFPSHHLQMGTNNNNNNADSAEGLSRIQAELDDIIRQLENAYPGCSTHQYHQQSVAHSCSGDKARIVQTANEIGTMLGEFVNHLSVANTTSASSYTPNVGAQK